MRLRDRVGPVLSRSEVADAVIRVVRQQYPEALVQDRGGYLRVLVEGSCRLSRGSIEAQLGRPLSLRRDLEAVMPSFKGNLQLSDDEVSWSFAPLAPR